MTSLKPTLPNPDIHTKKIPFFLLLMSASSSLMLVPGVVLIEQGGLVFSPSIASMVISLSWLHKMTECWIDKSERLSSMRKFIGKSLTSVSSGRFSKLFVAKRFFSQSGDGTRLRKEWVFICLFPKRSIFVCMILVLCLMILIIMG